MRCWTNQNQLFKFDQEPNVAHPKKEGYLGLSLLLFVINIIIIIIIIIIVLNVDIVIAQNVKLKSNWSIKWRRMSLFYLSHPLCFYQ